MAGGGRRRDGKPFKEGNTREDGSYGVGKGRPPEHTRFATGDGRKRGKRPKGARNFESDWEEELSKSVKVNLNGKVVRISAHRAQVLKTLELGSKGKERAQEIIYRKAERLQERRKPTSSRSDDELIAAWLEQERLTTAGPAIVGDDQAETPAPPDELSTEQPPDGRPSGDQA